MPLNQKERMYLQRRLGWSPDGPGMYGAAIRAPAEALRSWAFDSGIAEITAHNLNVPGCRPKTDYNPAKPPINDCRDAFRHAYWHALMAQRNRESAIALSDAYERSNPNNYRELYMDLHNDLEGRRIGDENRFASPAQLENTVAKSIEKGDLISNISKLMPLLIGRRRMRM